MDEVLDEIVQQPSPTDQTEGLDQGHEPSEGVEQAPESAHEPEAKKPQYIPKDRFDQVYARAKDAELRAQQAREEKARLEGELEAMKRTPPVQVAPTPPRYTPAQLQAMVDEGKATIGQVLAYQEESVRLDVEKKVDERLDAKLKESSKTTTLQRELGQYKQVVPEVLQPGTPERLAVEKEYAYLVDLGYSASDPRTELMAVRAALGSVETIQAKRKSKTIPTERETMQDTQSSGGAKTGGEPDLLKKLTSAERTHYQRMIDRGVYKGWDEVREERKFAATYR